MSNVSCHTQGQSLNEMLRDPIWQFVGVAISLIALGVAVVAIKAQRQRKSLSSYFSSDRPVLYLFNEAFKDRLVLNLDGTPVQGLSTYDVAIFNDGNVPVLPSDYAEPLAVQFGASSKVLAVAVTDMFPNNLGVTAEGSGGRFHFSPALLNPGDEFVVQFLVDQSSNDHYSPPVLSGRIAGVSALQIRSSRPARAYRLRFYRFVLLRATPTFVLGVLASLGASALYSIFASVR